MTGAPAFTMVGFLYAFHRDSVIRWIETARESRFRRRQVDKAGRRTPEKAGVVFSRVETESSSDSG